MNMEKKWHLAFLLSSMLISLVIIAGPLIFLIFQLPFENIFSVFASIIGVSLIFGSLGFAWLYLSITGLKIWLKKGFPSNILYVSRKKWSYLSMLLLINCIFSLVSIQGIIQSAIYDDFLWNAGETLSRIFIIGICVIFVWTLIFAIRELIFTKKQNGLKISPQIKNSINVHFIGFIIFGSGLGGIIAYAYINPCNEVECNCDANWGKAMGYELPSGTHYNPDLDDLNETSMTILLNLEKALQAWSCFERYGGYPKSVSADYSLYWGDTLLWCPLNSNEISLYGATQETGQIFLEMYRLEPNPTYLDQARKCADAIVSVQNPDTGGWWERAMFDESTGKGKIPDPNNRFGKAHYADGHFLSILKFLCEMFEVEQTRGSYINAMRYYDSIKLGLENIRDNRIPGGSWHKNSLANPGSYGYGSNLNDETTVNNIRALWLAELYFAENFSLAQPWAKSMALDVVDWLISVQGKGGSSDQMGWCDIYSQSIDYFNNIYYIQRDFYGIGGWNQDKFIGNVENWPTWGRAFEPPAMSIRATSGVLELLYEMWIMTANDTYLEPISNAIAWLNSPNMIANGTNIPDGDEYFENAWYLYYELGSNIPIMGLDGDGPFDSDPYTYDQTKARCCYGWFPYYSPLNIIDKYSRNEIRNFDIDVARLEWDEEANSVILTDDELEWKDQIISLIDDLNGDFYWTVDIELKTIQDSSPQHIRLIRDVDFLQNTKMMIQYLEHTMI